MELDGFTLRITLLALPGFIWVMMDSAFSPSNKRSQIEYLVNVLVFGVITYAFVAMAYSVGNNSFDIATFNDSEKFKLAKCVDEIFWSIIWAMILSVVWIMGRTYKVPYRLLNLFGISYNTGDIDIWTYVFTANKPKIKYANVRSYSQELIYSGYVDAYSDKLDLRELVMTEVRVFDFSGKFIFETPLIYVSSKVEEITVEFPAA